MIKELISSLIITEEEYHDGGLEAVLFILKYYKSNATIVYLNKLINILYDQKNTFQILKSVANQYGLIAVICDNVDIKSLFEYNQPVIINISSVNEINHFVVCHKCNKNQEFRIYDSRNGFYFASVISLQSVWKDNICLAFVNDLTSNK